jgi:phage baseplate assembly protein W
MKTLLIRNGDLDLSGATYTLVRGAGKVKQDLAVAMLEPLGTDRLHPRWGSMMASYIGSNINPTNLFAITAEVRRIVANYIATQGAARP